MRGRNFFDGRWGQPKDRHGDHRQADLGGPCVRQQLGQVVQGAHDAALRAGLAEEGSQLEDDQDQANPAHEARDDRVRHLGHVATEPQQAKGDLKDAREHDHGEGHGQPVLGVASGQARNHGRHHHGHRTGGLRDQARGPAKQGRKEAHQHGAPEAGGRTGARGDAEGQGHGQGDHRGGDTAEEITFDVVGADLIQQAKA